MNLKKRYFVPFFLLLALFIQSSFADVASPVKQLNDVANRMISSLEKNKGRLGSMRVIRGIVNRVLLPNIDLNRMSASVVGRYWRSATSSQRATFKREFAYMVTTTYALALASYKNDRVKFYPLRTNYAKRKTVRVRSIIIRGNGQRIPISYDVVRKGNHWKVYDFSIEHVSMVQSYRSQFQAVLASQQLPGLLRQLKIHNKR